MNSQESRFLGYILIGVVIIAAAGIWELLKTAWLWLNGQ